MSKHDLTIVDLDRFWYWINERHSIWQKRNCGESKPWTDDEIFQTYKFTNVFRELDRGTIALRQAEPHDDTPWKYVWNTIWYRMFNREEHILSLGWDVHYETLRVAIMRMYHEDIPIFTGAHLVNGVAGVLKHVSHLETLKKIWDDIHKLTADIQEDGTLEGAWRRLMEYRSIGRFIAYEIVSDLRWNVLEKAPDIYTWANIGPGCRRGLLRLDLPIEIESLHLLYRKAYDCLAPHVQTHLPSGYRDGISVWDLWPPFELREIEHSLCEFDKYERVRTGVGRPRQTYPGI